MRKIVNFATILLLCFVCITSVQAASSDAENPTELTLNETYESNIFNNHPHDYYSFTLNKETKIVIELSDVAMSHEYELKLHGSTIDDVTATQNIGQDMYIIKTLSPGKYYIDVNSDFSARTESFETNYTILVTDNLKDTFLYGQTGIDFKSVFVHDDFENSNTENWLDGFRPHYTYGTKTIKSDSNGKYMSFTPVDNSQYYIFEAKDIYSTELLYSQFDVKFPSGNMELQVRQATSNLDVNFKMAGRIRKTAYYLEYYSNGKWYKFYDTSNNWLRLNDTSKWYKIYMTLDVRTNMYSIYLLDRDSDTIISKVENISFAEPCTYISFYAFSSTSEICIDNVDIGNVYTDIHINGRYYVKIPLSGTRQYPYKVSAANYLYADDIIWSTNGISGISIDERTGMLTVSEHAKPGPVLISACKKYYPWIKTMFYIDLRK